MVRILVVPVAVWFVGSFVCMVLLHMSERATNWVCFPLELITLMVMVGHARWRHARRR